MIARSCPFSTSWASAVWVQLDIFNFLSLPNKLGDYINLYLNNQCYRSPYDIIRSIGGHPSKRRNVLNKLPKTGPITSHKFVESPQGVKGIVLDIETEDDDVVMIGFWIDSTKPNDGDF